MKEKKKMNDYNKQENKNNVLLLTVIGVATLLVAVIGATFAYFTANLSGQETATSVTVGAGKLEIEYQNGSSNLVPQSATGIEPKKPNDPDGVEPLLCPSQTCPYGAPVIVKEFSIVGTNTTEANMPYGLKLEVTANTFRPYQMGDYTEGEDDVDLNNATCVNTATLPLTYTLAFTNAPTPNGSFTPAVAGSNTTPVGIPTGASSVELGDGEFTGIVSDVVHSFVLKIYFTDNGCRQDYNKNKTFEAYVNTVIDQTKHKAYTTTTTTP